MLDNALQKLMNFRQTIYTLFPKRKDAIMNLLDSLTSHGHHCKSVIQLSNASCFERQYSSITDAIADGLPEAHWPDIRKSVYKEHRGCEYQKTPHHFIVDCTPAPRPYAEKLPDRYITHAPNPAPGNKPICVGHQYSVLVSSSHNRAEKDKNWVVPLSVKRVPSEQKGNELGMQQLNECIDELEIGEELSINVADSLYGTDKCREIATKKENLVHIFRLRNNRNVFLEPMATSSSGKGRNREFGDKMQLNSPETYPTYDEDTQFTRITRKGKTHTLHIKLWGNILLRGSTSFRSSEHPINLVQITVTNEQGNAVFKRPLWLGVLGKRRHELTLTDIQQAYAERYDIEHYFRFSKNNLLMDAYQTADAEHEDLWWQLCCLAYGQLYLSKSIVPSIPQPWERYLPEFKDNDTPGAISSPSKTQRGFIKLLDVIGTPAATCVPRGKPTGRKSGDIQIKKESHPIIFKTKKTPEKDAKTISLDSETQPTKPDLQEIDIFLELVQSSLKKIKLTPSEFSKLLINSS